MLTLLATSYSYIVNRMHSTGYKVGQSNHMHASILGFESAYVNTAHSYVCHVMDNKM